MIAGTSLLNLERNMRKREWGSGMSHASGNDGRIYMYTNSSVPMDTSNDRIANPAGYKHSTVGEGGRHHRQRRLTARDPTSSAEECETTPPAAGVTG